MSRFPEAPHNIDWTVSDTPTLSVVSVTPDVAKLWLSRNSVNRKLDSRRVSQYQKDMTNGDWKLTGSTIQFARGDGQLLDGQHRLTAVSRGSGPVDLSVARGLEHDAQKAIDQGAARTAAAIIGLEGYRNASSLASVAQEMIRLEDVRNGLKYNAFTPISGAVKLNWVKANTDCLDVVSFWKSRKPPMVNDTVWLSVALLLLRSDVEAGRKFLNGLSTGADLPSDSPILAARNSLLRLDTTNRNRHKAGQIHLLCRAWSKWRAGGSAKGFTFTEKPTDEELRKVLP